MARLRAPWRRRLFWAFALACVSVVTAGAQMSVLQPRDAAQPQDEEFARLVKEWTTRPEFISPLVDHLPKAPASLRRKTSWVITSARRKS